MMHLFDIVAGKVQIHPDLLAIPCFNQVWEADKTESKEKANKYISYIILKNYYNSPYVLTMLEKDIEPRLKKEIFNNENFILPEDILKCEKDYIGFTNTKTLQMLKSMRKKIDSISLYYDQSLGEDLDEKKIKDLLAGMEKVKGTFQTIDYLEKVVKTEELNNSKVRGGGEMNPYELPS